MSDTTVTVTWPKPLPPMAEPEKTGTTMREIAEAYDARRAEILGRIERRECSASMSGIEYYHKPWADLDMGDALDRDTIIARLTYAEKQGCQS